MESKKPDRPRVVISIPPLSPKTPQQLYSQSSVTPYVNLTGGFPSHGGQPEWPAYIDNNSPIHGGHKTRELFFKQFTDIKDFTMNKAKSSLSFGEKITFWLYAKISLWSKQWFTHIFLILMMALYSVLGGILFRSVEGDLCLFFVLLDRINSNL